MFFVNKNYDIIPFLSQSLTLLQDRGKTFICERVIARALYIYIWPRPFSRNRPACYRKARGKYRSSGKPNTASWSIWKKVNSRYELFHLTGTFRVLLEEIDDLWPNFITHSFYSHQQRDYITLIKEASRITAFAVMQLDFAQNCFSLYEEKCKLHIMHDNKLLSSQCTYESVKNIVKW